MNNFLAIALMIIFSLLALVHVYWALGGKTGWQAALPEIDGRLAFTPSVRATYTVAAFLFLCAILVSITAGFITLPIPLFIFKWLSFGLSLGLLLRAIGDFNLVGFFKHVRTTHFANLDTIFYSPLCLLLSMGVFIMALGI